jgi:hypothetical protein
LSSPSSLTEQTRHLYIDRLGRPGAVQLRTDDLSRLLEADAFGECDRYGDLLSLDREVYEVAVALVLAVEL